MIAWTDRYLWLMVCVSTLLWGSVPSNLWAEEAAFKAIATELDRKLLPPETTLKEVQTYVTEKIVPVPEFQSVEAWERYRERVRSQVLDQVVFAGQAAKWRTAETAVHWHEPQDGGPGYKLQKLRYEALPGQWIPAVLYIPEKLEGKVPVFLNVNGHDPNGKAADYKQLRCINLAKRGCLVLNTEWFGMGQLREAQYSHARMNQLDLCGAAGLAPFYLAMSRGLDLLLAHPAADPTRVGVSGLSGGGWQTIIISALDPRVTLSNPVAGYSSFKTRAQYSSDLGDSEQTPVDLGLYGDYAQLTALRAPLPTLLTYNAKDNCCFAAGHALPPLVDAAAPLYKLHGKPENLRTHINEDPGDHNFGLDNRQALYRMVGDHFFPNQDFDAKEIPSAAEVKSAADLNVPLPEGNPGFTQLAAQLSRDLPRSGPIPMKPEQQQAWGMDLRKMLMSTLKYRELGLQAEVESQSQLEASAGGEAYSVIHWKLTVGERWTVPATEIFRGEPTETTLLIGDAGRKTLLPQVETLLKAGQRVIALDPYYCGEARPASRDYLYSLLIATIGDRPLGVQVEQLLAVAIWQKALREKSPVRIMTVGPRTSVMALCAMVVEPQQLESATLHQSWGSLKEVLEQNLAYTEAPEIFCFGLLETCDIPHLVVAARPRTVEFVEPSARVQQELQALPTGK